MRNKFLIALLPMVLLGMLQCQQTSGPKEVSAGKERAKNSVAVYVKADGTDGPVSGVLVHENQGAVDTTNADGFAGTFSIGPGDTLFFNKVNEDSLVVVFEEPLTISSVTVYLESNDTEYREVSGSVTLGGSPCGIAYIFNLDNTEDTTTCVGGSGMYKLPISTRLPYRIGYSLYTNPTAVARISINGGSNGEKLDIALDEIGDDSLNVKR